MTSETTDLKPANPDVATIRGADLLVESLIAADVDTLFGVPGDTGVVFYDALYDRVDDIRHVLARDERHAAKMADAYARAANRVGVVEVSSGGGTTFVVGGLGEAYASGVPILLITSDIHSSSRGTGALTEIDQLALFSAVTKWGAIVDAAEEIPSRVAEAMHQATTGRPAPVVLVFPEDVLDHMLSNSLSPTDIASALPAVRPMADEADVVRAATALSAAQRPCAIVGSGVHVSEAYVELSELADHLALSVATTIHGKGTIPDSNPWSIGTVGNNGGRPEANELLESADVVLLVGTRANATDTNSWRGPSRTGTTVIQIDVDPLRAGRNFPGSIRLVGDAKVVLAQLRSATSPAADASRSQRRSEVADAKAHWHTSLGPIGVERTRHANLPTEQLLPSDLVRVIREVLDSDTLVVADPGTPTPNVSVYWETDQPGRTVIVPRGHGPMGYAIPAAVGASFARPGKPVVALTADGSFAMACGELETVARLRLPILYVQMTNNSLGWIKMLQHLYSDRRYFGVDPGPIDSVAVASACGLRSVRVDDLDAFRKIVEDFAERPTALYVDVQVPHMIDYLPPVPAWAAALQETDAQRPVY